MYQAILKEGEEELDRATAALVWSGLAAGLSMGLSMVAEGLLRSHLPDEGWRPLVAKLGYSAGFLIVTLGRQQLFTENTLTPILPLLRRRPKATLANVARLWGVVLVANLLGVLTFARSSSRTRRRSPPHPGDFRRARGRRAAERSGHDRAARHLCRLADRLMVWLLPFAESARI